MNLSSVQFLILSFFSDFGLFLLVVFGASITLSLSFFAFHYFRRFLYGTTIFGNPTLDRLTYKPYKNYNRWRSRSWNLKHTSDL